MADWNIEGKISADSLLQAHQALKRSLAQPKNEFTRNSSIQCFEFTLELAWKTLKRLLDLRKVTVSSPRETIRLAAREGWISEPERWLEYFDLRNLSVHSYRETVAEQIYLQLSEFDERMDRLVQSLKQLG